MNRSRRLCGLALGLGAAGLALGLALATPARAADKVVFGLDAGAAGSNSPIYIAKDKGYFAQQGIDAQFVFFGDASTLIASIVAGSVDVGTTGLGAGLYNVATNGDIHVVAGGAFEKAGFPGETILTSVPNWNKGLQKPSQLGGKKIGLPGLGGAYHYDMLALGSKFGFAVPTSNLVPLKSKENAQAALLAGSVNAIVTSAAPAIEARNSGQGKIICFVGDEVPYMSTALFGNAKAFATRRDVMVRMMRGLLQGVSTYIAAFQQTDASGKVVFSADANDLLKLLSNDIKQPPDVISESLQYISPNEAFDPSEITTQVANWKKTGLLNAGVDPSHIVDLSVWNQAAKG